MILNPDGVVARNAHCFALLQRCRAVLHLSLGVASLGQTDSRHRLGSGGTDANGEPDASGEPDANGEPDASGEPDANGEPDASESDATTSSYRHRDHF